MVSVRKCILVSCPNKNVSVGKDLSYYGLPKDAVLRGKWLQWIAAQNKCSIETLLCKKCIYVCSKHFKESCKGSRRLKVGSIPSEVPELYETANDNNIDNVLAGGHVINCAQVDSNVYIVNEQNGTRSDNDLENDGADQFYPIIVKNYSGNIIIAEGSDNKEESVLGTVSCEEQFSKILAVDTVNGRLSEYTSVYEVDMELCEVKLGCAAEESGPQSDMQFTGIAEVSMKSGEVKLTTGRQTTTDQDRNILSYTNQEVFGECYQTGCDVNTLKHVESCTAICIDSTDDVEPSENMFGVMKIDDPCKLQSVEDIFYRKNEVSHEVVFENVICGNDESMNQETRYVPIRKKKSKKKCSGCDTPVGSFFAFPSIGSMSNENDEGLERCKHWVCQSGNMDLLKKPSKDLHRQHFLCSKHFKREMFTNTNRNRLVAGAKPSEDFDRLSLSDAIMSKFPIQGEPNIGNVMFENENGIDMSVAGKLDMFQKKFNEIMFGQEWRICERCKIKFLTQKDSKKTCSYSKQICEKFAALEIDEVPDELKGLTFIEEMLIAQVHPIVTIIKLKNHQLGYQGHVINFPQDVKGFVQQLPHRIEGLSCVLTVRVSRNLKPVDFQVRAAKVRDALVWLKNNNKFYFDIEIDEANLNLLPEDDNVFDLLNGIEVNEEINELNVSSDSDENLRELEEDIYESASPIMSKATTSDQVESILSWPTIGSQPINEFKDDNYIAQAFPCLFPKGNGILSRGKNQLASSLNYFKHLMRYKDGRFAQHNRFRYFALNSYMRWCAIKNGNLFIRTKPEFQNMKLDEFKEELKKNPGLIKKLMYRNSSISGSKSYWFARGKELLEMVEQIGLPTLFCTLSAADLHWPDLFQIMAPDEDYNNISMYRRKQLVKLNPMIVDAFFLRRAEVFMDEVLLEKYDVKDYWFRIEYQHRGSPHLHGVLWFDGAPDVTDILEKTEEEQEAIVEYFSNLVTAFHPNIDEPPSDVHPCQKKLLDIENLDEDLAQILNRVQRHTVCSKSYCIRKNKNNGSLQCRFKFPQEYQAEPKININETGNVEFLPQRNDERLNKYNPYILQTWRANIDVAPVISKAALINYLAKYISKSEKRSDHLADLMNIINETTDQNGTAKKIVQRLYMKACAERDFSAQETCHLLMGLKLYSSGGREFVTLNFSDNNEWRLLRNDENATNLIEKYQTRSEALDAMCLWHVAQKYKMPSEKFLRSKQNIVQIYPKYSEFSLNSENIEKYYKQQVMLYVPWRHTDQLKGNYETWKEVYDSYKEIIVNNSGKCCSLNGAEGDAEEFEELVVNPGHDVEQWMTVSGMGPTGDIQVARPGNRDVDMNYDWHESLKDYEEHGGISALLSFLKNMKKECSENGMVTASSSHIILNDDQQKVIQLLQCQIMSHDECSNASNNMIPQTAIIQGKAGTGKSLIISRVAELVTNKFGSGSVLLLGPTGVSALNINGSTIHSKLLIKSFEEFTALNGQQLHYFKKKMRDVRFVIVDEYSMVGPGMLYMIDQRLRQAKDVPTEEFGGLFLYLFGDVAQLPPVITCACYSDNPKTMEEISGKVLYDNIDTAFILEKVHRQSDEVFLKVLSNIGQGTVSYEDFEILQSRFEKNVTFEEAQLFDDAPHFYPTNLAKDKYNDEKLSGAKDKTTNLLRPVAKVPAKVSSKSKRFISEDDPVEATLYLSKGAKIMLRCNLWTEKGLVNGSVGIIQDIVYHPDATPQIDPPSVLICTFDSYKGPYLDEIKKTVPIAPFQYSQEHNNEKHSYSQFPISLNYGCTIHKSQGLSVERAFIDIGEKEMKTGLTYVALSRVKSLSGLLLKEFPFNRISRLNKSGSIKLRQKWINQLKTKLYQM